MVAPWMAALWIAVPWMAASWMAASRMAAPDLSSLQNSLRTNWSFGNPYFLLTACLSIQFFASLPFSQCSHSPCLWLSTPDCVASSV